MPVDQEAVKSIFLVAVDKATPAERAAYLDQACGGDHELRREVEKLLAAHESPGSFLEKPAHELAATGPPEGPPGDRHDEIQGSHIGPYRLLQPLGEGGMGAVFLAEQEKPVKRRVALKIIKSGMDSANIVARFDAERLTLAMMDHPNIAKVHDAGTTETGLPYFVMELVQGVPMTRYCDENRLTIRERLELFIPVCQAILHAHQKGIIHRDIKPSNVLVTRYDSKPVPKVIDFGIAKAIKQPLLDAAMATQLGTIVGTVQYMSPEQADLNALNVDIRSDIYSLGVMLYELLTGTTPLESSRLREKPIAEVLRLIKEEEAPRPSARLTGLGERLPTISAQRKTEPAKLMKLLKGDLDWIVSKAMEKDRARRYETARELARDVERHLADEPVDACPPSWGYRLRKYAKKHKTALVTLVMIGTLVSASLIIITLLWLSEKDLRQLAEKRLLTTTAQKVAASSRTAGGAYRRDDLRALLALQAFRFQQRGDGTALAAVDDPPGSTH
jgi:serine/threonine protein kinase